MQPPSWYVGYVSCWHGTTATDIWEGWPPPPLPYMLAIQQEALQNHQRVLYECTCIYAPPTAPTATMSFPQQTGINTDASVALAQTPQGTLPSGFGTDGFGRLNAQRDGMANISVSFTLARSVGNGGGGFAGLRLPDAATPDLTATSVATASVVDINGVATGQMTWTGQVVAGTSFEVDYWNGTQFIEDIQDGTLVVMLQ